MQGAPIETEKWRRPQMLVALCCTDGSSWKVTGSNIAGAAGGAVPPVLLSLCPSVSRLRR
jgi:hypothetical protein